MPSIPKFLKNLFFRGNAKIRDFEHLAYEPQYENDDSEAAAEESNTGQLLSSSTPSSDEVLEESTLSPEIEEKVRRIILLLKRNERLLLQSGNLTAQLNDNAELSATLEKVQKGINALIKAKVIAARSYELQGNYRTKYGDYSATLGAYANSTLDFSLNFADLLNGILIDANANASVSVEVNAQASFQSKTFQIGELGADFAVCAEAYAKAEASVSGTLLISSSGLTIGGNVKAGASVGVAIGGTSSLAFRGTKVISLSSRLEASVGASVELGGSFSYVNGVLKIKLDIAGTIGAGGAIHEDLEVDFAAIKEIIAAELATIGVALKEKINTYLREKMLEVIAELEAAGDDTVPLLEPGITDSESYDPNEVIDLGLLRDKPTSHSAWASLKRIKDAGKNRSLVAKQEIIEICIRLTDKN